jgi:hypothetical protein
MPRSDNDEATKLAARAGDRRSAGSRMLVQLPVTVISEGFRHPCKTVDISTCGMVVELNESLASREPHIVYQYEVELEGGPRVRVAGRTAWRRGALQGVRFILHEEDRQVIADFMHEERQRRASVVDRLELAEHLDRLRAIGKQRTAA